VARAPPPPDEVAHLVVDDREAHGQHLFAHVGARLRVRRRQRRARPAPVGVPPERGEPLEIPRQPLALELHRIVVSAPPRRGPDRIRPTMRPAASAASSMKMRECSESGAPTTTGTPVSPPKRTLVSMGISPRNAEPTSCASLRPPPREKISSWCPHDGHT